MVLKEVVDTVKKTFQKLQESLLEFWMKYMIEESERERLIHSLFVEYQMEKKLVVSLSKEK